jgi:hypothetical protein
MAANKKACSEGFRFADEVDACVPEHPKPFEQYALASHVVVWVPALDMWMDKASPVGPGGGSTDKAPDLRVKARVYLRSPRPVAGLPDPRDVL